MNKQQEPFDEMEAAKAGAQHEPVGELSDTSGEPAAPSPAGDALAVCQQQAKEYLSGWKRAQADYQNLRRTAEQERTDTIRFANQGLLHDLIPLVDHFSLAFKAIPEKDRNSNWLKGIEHIMTNFKQVLKDYGVEIIPTVGQQFDPSKHEAVSEVESDKPEGEIVEELGAGFWMHGKVLRPAKVTTSKGKSK